MNAPIVIELDGAPQGKGRLRHRIVRSRANPMGYASGYTPGKTRKYEEKLAAQAARTMDNRSPIAGPVSVQVCAYVPIPKGWSKRKRTLALAGEIRPTVRPDIDNYLKSACDALNSVVWIDDKQVIDGRVEKFYSERPRLRIVVTEIEASQERCSLPCPTQHTGQRPRLQS
jgi:Holliday junction resolvase RusA-like endonuclease